jgi:hypothetical protein
LLNRLPFADTFLGSVFFKRKEYRNAFLRLAADSQQLDIRLVARNGVESAERFVHEEERWVVNQCAAD